MNILGFIGSTAFLFGIGYIPAGRLVDRNLQLVLALPVGALINTITLLVLTWLKVPYSVTSIVLANIVAMAILIISFKPYFKAKSSILKPSIATYRTPRPIHVACVVIILCTGIYALSGSVLPTFHYDSTTNWSMRSKVSYFRAELVFDNQNGLLEKPQYPVLFHALQITAMQLQSQWNDMAANGVTLLLSISLFLLIYILLHEVNLPYAIVTFSLLLGLPLITMHMAQGYADLLLIGFSLVSLLMFIRYMQTKSGAYLLLSSVCVSAGVWTKSEGLIFCLIPWLVMAGMYCYKNKTSWRPMLPGVLLSLLWPLFALVHNLQLTPHGSSDTVIEISSAPLLGMLSALFVTGSFGIAWYGIILAGILVATRHSQNTTYLITLVWGLLSFGGYVFVYLFTSNTVYLLNGQSFDRQMLLPASLLIVSLSLLLQRNDNVVPQ